MFNSRILSTIGRDALIALDLFCLLVISSEKLTMLDNDITNINSSQSNGRGIKIITNKMIRHDKSSEMRIIKDLFYSSKL